MSDIRLIVADPGHFHAALVQREMYPNLSPNVHVYTPVGPELADYLMRITRFNTRKEQPTHWQLEEHTTSYGSCPRQRRPSRLAGQEKSGSDSLVEGNGFELLVP